MFKSNWLFPVFALVLTVAVSSCCCCHDDDDDLCPDLIVHEIDPQLVNVSCPGGFGTCVTTVTFTVENIGNADAGAFNIRVVLDPSSSVVLNEFVIGLNAGDSINVTVVSPPGGNCYDPDCSISISVDSDDNVSECEEDNNATATLLLG